MSFGNVGAYAGIALTLKQTQCLSSEIKTLLAFIILQYFNEVPSVSSSWKRVEKKEDVHYIFALVVQSA